MSTYLWKGLRLGVIPWAFAVWLLLAPDSRAQEPASAAPDVQKLLERLDKLEQRNEELEKTVRQLKAQDSPVSQQKPDGARETRGTAARSRWMRTPSAKSSTTTSRRLRCRRSSRRAARTDSPSPAVRMASP